MRTSPRRLGLLGGITWHSSLIYERLINEGIADALPGQSADLLVRSYNFGQIAVAQAAGDWDKLGEQFAADARWLVDGGAEAILICANTMHIVAPQVEAAVDVPVIHVIDETAKAIHAAGVETAGLLGTGFTMRMPFYRERMVTHGVTTIAPEEPELTAFHELIYERVARGIITDVERQGARDASADLIARGAHAIIAGCTEVPLILTAEELPVPYFDSMALHAQAAIDFALAE